MTEALKTSEDRLPSAILLQPDLDGREADFTAFCREIRDALNTVNDSEARVSVLATIRRRLGLDTPADDSALKLLFAQSVLLDFVAQGRDLEISEDGNVTILPPFDGEFAEKEQVRASHLWGRNDQLRERSVQAFVKGMERRRHNDRGWHSIFSLMRDGRELARQLELAKDELGGAESEAALSRMISPYLQFVDRESICEFTGLQLSDVWRYFRHTWTNEYKSVPGRHMMILVRDAAAPNHPVIGIAALGSSVVQNGIRDEWIGWKSENFVKDFVRNPTVKVAKWLLKSVDRLIGEIYYDDLADICPPDAIAHPSLEVIQELLMESDKAIGLHRANPQRSKHGKQKLGDYGPDFFSEEARSHLFRSKRCKQLSKLLGIRHTFQSLGFDGTARTLRDGLDSVKFQSALSQLIRMVKAEHVGIDMMDITVCGAVAPYNSLLGGKLVCLLLCSPEVVGFYNSRYGDQVSVIASAMKGSPVIRKPKLVLLCTTSLYGARSSQYNRVALPLREIGIDSDEKISFANLGHSRGYGTYQFSVKTIRIAEILNARKKGPRVNSIFGEGVNPLMRKLREALASIRLDHDELMLHGNRRVTYGIALAKNFREVLLGLDTRPQYLVPLSDAANATEKIAAFWRRRWLSGRVERAGVLSSVAEHTLAYPIRHGAAVPWIDDDEHVEQKMLFGRA